MIGTGITIQFSRGPDPHAGLFLVLLLCYSGTGVLTGQVFSQIVCVFICSKMSLPLSLTLYMLVVHELSQLQPLPGGSSIMGKEKVREGKKIDSE